MLPSLCRLCIITDGSRRASDIDAVLDGFPLVVKLLIETLRLYSSSTARRLRCRRNKKSPPAIAQIATTPTTTPAAMPAVFGPFGFSFAAEDGAGAVVVWPGAVTTTVFPMVTTDGDDLRVVLGTGAAVVCGVDVGEVMLELTLGLELALELAPGAFATVPPVPVNATDHVLSPPPS